MSALEFFKILPIDNTASIISFCDSKSQNQLSVTNKKIKAIVDNLKETLTVTIPWFHNRDGYLSILVNLLKRFPNIKRLSYVGEFTEHHGDIFRPLILFLQQQYPKNLIEWKSSLCTHPKASLLSKDFLDALNHTQTLSLEVSKHYNVSVITDLMINSILEKSKNLTSFTFSSFQFSTDADIEFHLSKCPNLEKVKLCSVPQISNKTIQQLGLCRNLKELSIDDTCKGARELEQFLCTDHGLKLKVLNLQNTLCLLEDHALNLATKHLPDLEFFSRKFLYAHQSGISNRGLLQLTNNCKKLNTLVFNFKNITDEGISHFAQNTPRLRKLSICEMHKITQAGLQSLTYYCINLEALELVHFSDLTLAALSSLATNCKHLRFLSLSNCCFKETTEQDLKKFIDHCKALQYIEILNCDGISNTAIKNLNHEIFPRVRKPPYRFFYSI